MGRDESKGKANENKGATKRKKAAPNFSKSGLFCKLAMTLALACVIPCNRSLGDITTITQTQFADWEVSEEFGRLSNANSFQWGAVELPNGENAFEARLTPANTGTDGFSGEIYAFMSAENAFSAPSGQEIREISWEISYQFGNNLELATFLPVAIQDGTPFIFGPTFESNDILFEDTNGFAVTKGSFQVSSGFLLPTIDSAAEFNPNTEHSPIQFGFLFDGKVESLENDLSGQEIFVGIKSYQVSVQTVPEPGVLFPLLAAGFPIALLYRRRN